LKSYRSAPRSWHLITDHQGALPTTDLPISCIAKEFVDAQKELLEVRLPEIYTLWLFNIAMV
jgi:hypothetical protein